MSDIVKFEGEQNTPATGIYSSVTAETRDEKLAVFDAVSNSESLEDMVGKAIDVENIIIQPVEMNDEKTGEVRDANRIVLITDEGKAYGCVSSGVETSIKNLFAIVGSAPWVPAIRFEVTKKQGRNGYKFMTLNHVAS